MTIRSNQAIYGCFDPAKRPRPSSDSPTQPSRPSRPSKPSNTEFVPATGEPVNTKTTIENYAKDIVVDMDADRNGRVSLEQNEPVGVQRSSLAQLADMAGTQDGEATDAELAHVLNAYDTESGGLGHLTGQEIATFEKAFGRYDGKRDTGGGLLQPGARPLSRPPTLY